MYFDPRTVQIYHLREHRISQIQWKRERGWSFILSSYISSRSVFNITDNQTYSFLCALMLMKVDATHSREVHCIQWSTLRNLSSWMTERLNFYRHWKQNSWTAAHLRSFCTLCILGNLDAVCFLQWCGVSLVWSYTVCFMQRGGVSVASSAIIYNIVKVNVTCWPVDPSTRRPFRKRTPQ